MEKETEKKKTEEQPKRKMWDIRPYLAIGTTAVLVVLVCIIIFFLILRFGELVSGLKALGQILQAVLIGAVLSYVLNPVMVFFERHLQKAFRKRMTDEKRIRKISRSIATAGAVLVFLGIIAALLCMIIPQLIISVEHLTSTLPGQMQNLMDRMQAFSRGDTPLAAVVREIITHGTAYLQNWIQNVFLNQAQDLMSYITSGVVGVVKTIFNFIVGIIISIYILMKKETFISQLKKMIYAVFPSRGGNRIMEVLRKSDDIFGGFLIGEIIDAIIIGFRRAVYWKISVCAAGQRDCGRDKYHSVLRTVSRGDSGGAPDLSGKSSPRAVFSDYYPHHTAVGRKCNQTKGAGGQYGAVAFLGNIFYSAVWRNFRFPGNAVRSTGICDHLLSD